MRETRSPRKRSYRERSTAPTAPATAKTNPIRIAAASPAPSIGRRRAASRPSTSSSATQTSAESIDAFTKRLKGSASGEPTRSGVAATQRMARTPSTPPSRPAKTMSRRTKRRRRSSMSGAARRTRVSASVDATAASRASLQVVRTDRRSEGSTHASMRASPSLDEITKPYGDGPRPSPARARSMTGTIASRRTNVSRAPGTRRTPDSTCSATTVPRREADGRVRSIRGSMRTIRGPSASGSTKSVAGPSSLSLGKSETRPAQATGTASLSYTVIPVSTVAPFESAPLSSSNNRPAAAVSPAAALIVSWTCLAATREVRPTSC